MSRQTSLAFTQTITEFSSNLIIDPTTESCVLEKGKQKMEQEFDKQKV